MFSLKTEGIWKKTEDFSVSNVTYFTDCWRAYERFLGQKLLARLSFKTKRRD